MFCLSFFKSKNPTVSEKKEIVLDAAFTRLPKQALGQHVQRNTFRLNTIICNFIVHITCLFQSRVMSGSIIYTVLRTLKNFIIPKKWSSNFLMRSFCGFIFLVKPFEQSALLRCSCMVAMFIVFLLAWVGTPA